VNHPNVKRKSRDTSLLPVTTRERKVFQEIQNASSFVFVSLLLAIQKKNDLRQCRFHIQITIALKFNSNEDSPIQAIEFLRWLVVELKNICMTFKGHREPFESSSEKDAKIILILSFGDRSKVIVCLLAIKQRI
jgi:hypothetical protein